MTLEFYAELLVLVLAIVAAWLSLRPSTPMEWERLWKVTLATVIRGEIQASGKGQADWWKALEVVPFHPAGRDAYEKLFSPSVDTIGVPALEGERALVETLLDLSDPSARYEHMFRDCEAAEDALMANPAELGPAYDPSLPMAPGVDWESIASWDAKVQSAVARRLNDVVVAVVGMDTDDMLNALPHGSVWRVDDISEAGFLTLLKASHQRLAIIAKGNGACTTLELLHGSPQLRDRLVVFLSMASPLQSDHWKGWMDENFQHKAFDTELNRRTLYMAISDPGDALIDARSQLFPVPPVPPSGWEPIEAVDLGILPLEKQDPTMFARALWVLLTFCFHSR